MERGIRGRALHERVLKANEEVDQKRFFTIAIIIILTF